MKKYDQYKNSGVEWFGEIPEHWEVKKLKYSSSIYNGDSLNETKKNKFESDNLDDLAYISSKDIDLDTSIIIYENGLRIPQNQLKYKVAPKESSLICIEGGSAGRKIAFSNQDICFVNKLACVKAKNNVNSKFIYHTLKGSLFQTQFKLAMSGMIGGVAISSINNFYVLNPPKEEQSAIANFLDDKTTKIDQAIAIKQKQIELLKERRQILIHKAVTRGLNDNVNLIDSGVEWIGEIPEHWEVKRLKEICKAFGRIGFRGYTTSDLVDEGDGAITISPSNIKEEFMIFEKCSYLSWNKYNESPEIQIFENDILMVKTGSTYGKIGIVKNLPQKATINPQLLVLKDIKINADYFYSILKTHIVQTQIETEVIGSTIPTISETKIMNIKVAIPKSDEIEKIVEKTNEINLKFDSAISLKEQEIEKLKEYKMSLIDGVVTGKVKVF